jgi:hypothetical protein
MHFLQVGRRAIRVPNVSPKHLLEEEGQSEAFLFKTESDDFWTIPEELPFRSSNAERSYFACDLSSSVTPMRGCTYIAQYGPYVVLFDIDWIPGYSMNYADLEKILQAIDEKSYW